MKKLASIAILAPLLGSAVLAQVPEPQPATTPLPASAPATTLRTLFTAEQLDQLLGPIALYPDALVALILPASTNPSDVVLASRFLKGGGDPAQADDQPWDDSVRALARYTQVVTWMDDNLAWTRQLGDAFASQPADVMNAIQRLRSRARDAGTLMNTPQQQVIYANSSIEIVPTNPEIIYVPYYDPAVVYVPRTYLDYTPESYFSFSIGFAAGWWLSYGCDWHDHRIWTVNRPDRERYWREHRRDWHVYHAVPRPHDGDGPQIHPWRPRPDIRPPHSFPPSRPTQIVQPEHPRDRGHDFGRPGSPRESADQRRWHVPTGLTPNPTPAVGPTAGASAPSNLPSAPPLHRSDSPGRGPHGFDRGPQQGNTNPPDPIRTNPQPADRPRLNTMPADRPRYTPPAAVNSNASAPAYTGPRWQSAPASPVAPPHSTPAYVAPQPRPTPSVQHSPPPAPAPQPAPQQQSSSGGGDEKRPFVRIR